MLRIGVKDIMITVKGKRARGVVVSKAIITVEWELLYHQAKGNKIIRNHRDSKMCSVTHRSEWLFSTWQQWKGRGRCVASIVNPHDTRQMRNLRISKINPSVSGVLFDLACRASHCLRGPCLMPGTLVNIHLYKNNTASFLTCRSTYAVLDNN